MEMENDENNQSDDSKENLELELNEEFESFMDSIHDYLLSPCNSN